MEESPYKRLAERLDALPNGFPPTEDGVELHLLAKIFTPEEAELAAQLRLTQETPKQIAGRVGGDPTNDSHPGGLPDLVDIGCIKKDMHPVLLLS